MTASDVIRMVDLHAQRRRLGPRLRTAIEAVLEHGQFIMGPEVSDLEDKLSGRAEVKHALTMSSGTDALYIALLALDIGPGDAVFVPSFTFVATAEVVSMAGAVPFFVDVREDTFNMDRHSLAESITAARRMGLPPRVVVPVDLFGQPADYDALNELMEVEGLAVLADAAQSFGGSWCGRPVGSLGTITATSFFPSKPLGCYGDGGAAFTDDPALAARMSALRLHGGDRDKKTFDLVGTNARLDTLQAAILLCKLSLFDDELHAREKIACHYSDALEAEAGVPMVLENATSAWAQYTILVPTGHRDRIRSDLRKAGIPTAVYYATPIHLQQPYRDAPRSPGGLPVTQQLADTTLSLPFHPYLDSSTQDRVVDALLTSLKGVSN